MASLCNHAHGAGGAVDRGDIANDAVDGWAGADGEEMHASVCPQPVPSSSRVASSPGDRMPAK